MTVVDGTGYSAANSTMQIPTDPLNPSEADPWGGSLTSLQFLDGITLFAGHNANATLRHGSGTVHVNDVLQGMLADCFLHAVIIAKLRKSPSSITGIFVTPGSNDPANQFTVNLYDLNGTLSPQMVTVDLTLGNSQARLSGDYRLSDGAVEVWPIVLEMAIAKMQGIEFLANGDPLDAMRILEGSINGNNRTKDVPSDSNETISGYLTGTWELLGTRNSEDGEKLPITLSNMTTISTDHVYVVVGATATAIKVVDPFAPTVEIEIPKADLWNVVIRIWSV